MDFIDKLLTPANLCYLISVILAPILVRGLFRLEDFFTKRRRAARGLPEDQLLGPSAHLAQQRSRAFLESAAILLAILLFPFLAAMTARFLKAKLGDTIIASLIVGELAFPAELSNWKIATGVMLAGFALAASNVIKSYVSGLLFFTAITMKKGLQVGDRVSLLGHSGRITAVGPLFLQLVTNNDDFVTLPTSQLWSEPVVSANAGARSSLCVMEFRVAPFATSQQRQTAEDAIWESIQASVYSDMAHPIQIYYEQERNGILITAKAYVASTYREREFKSDVTRAFLEVCSDAGIPLAFDGWHVDSSPTSGDPKWKDAA